MKALRYFLLSVLAVGAVNSSAAEQQQAPTDVRVLIDVSGSMRENDPNNLRQSALQLLVNLLPAEASGGVWTFGQWVNMVIKPSPVNDEWRRLAIEESKKIASHGLYTNIGGALDNASYDFGYSYFNAHDRSASVILLTDGKVDIDKDPSIDSGERERILTNILDKYVAAGVKIHTVALSADADQDLLQTLSNRTDGQFSVANSADELSRIFLKTLDEIAPSTEVAINNNQFVIDSSINEFTALVFRDRNAPATGLNDPSGRRMTSDDTVSNVRWYVGGDYDLITVSSPSQGTWQIDAAEDNANRVSIVSNLSMRIQDLPEKVEQGYPVSFVVEVLQQGEVVTDRDFLSLIEVSGSAINADLGQVQTMTSIPSAAGDGRYVFNWSPISSGAIDLQLDVTAPTFDRRQNAQVDVSALFASQFSFDDKTAELSVTGEVVSKEIDLTSIRVDASVYPALSEAAAFDVDAGSFSWRGVLAEKGSYDVEFSLSGNFIDGQAFSGVLITTSQNSMGVAQPPKPSPVAKVPAKEEGIFGLTKKQTIYAAVGLANVVLILLAIWAYRRFMGGAKEEPSEAEAQAKPMAEPLEESYQAPTDPLEEVEESIASLDDLQAVDIQEDAATDSLDGIESFDDLLNDEELYQDDTSDNVDDLLSEAHADLMSEDVNEPVAEEEFGDLTQDDAEVSVDESAEDALEEALEEEIEDDLEVEIPDVFDDSVADEVVDALDGDDVASIEIDEDVASKEERPVEDEILVSAEIDTPSQSEEPSDETDGEEPSDTDEIVIDGEDNIVLDGEVEEQINEIVLEDELEEQVGEIVLADQDEPISDEQNTFDIDLSDDAEELLIDDVPELNDVVSEDELENVVNERSVFDALGDNLDDLSLTGSGFTPASEKTKDIDFSALDDMDLDAALNDMLSGTGISEEELDKFDALVADENQKSNEPVTESLHEEAALADPSEVLEDQLVDDLNDIIEDDELLALSDEDDLELNGLDDLDELLGDLDDLDALEDEGADGQKDGKKS